VSGTSASYMPVDSLPSTMESTPPSAASVSTPSSSFETKTDDHHRHKRVKLENDADQQNYPSHSQFPYKDRSISSTTINLMQSPSGTSGPPIGHYAPQQSAQQVHRQPITSSAASTNNYGRIPSHANSISPTHATYLNSYVENRRMHGRSKHFSLSHLKVANLLPSLRITTPCHRLWITHLCPTASATRCMATTTSTTITILLTIIISTTLINSSSSSSRMSLGRSTLIIRIIIK
jgi:hypothetical protein